MIAYELDSSLIFQDDMLTDPVLAGIKVHYNVLLDCIQVKEFQTVASEFLQRLKTTGPGLPNTDLSKGLELLKKFQVTHA